MMQLPGIDIIAVEWHHCVMRTTLNLDDDVFQVARVYAQGRSLALGKAVSELVRKGLRAPVGTRVVNGVHVFDLPAGGPRISSERVKELESELE
jgi:hypothetical protein